MRLRTEPVVLALVIAATAMMVGCAENGRVAPEWQASAKFGVAEDLPRVVLYGDLARHLPRFNPTPALDEFLYGPAPTRLTILRNPQGLEILGTKLLVCDQGYPDIIGIDLASGRSTAWEDGDRPPRCPIAIVAGADGFVYVADPTLRAVLVYSSGGGFVEQLLPTATVDDPDRSFRPASLLLNGGILYIGNVGDHRVDRWSTVDRQWLPPIVPPADGSGFMAPTGLAMTSDGVLLIVDSLRARVFRFSSEGKWLRPIGRPGRQDGEFVRPKQVCVTPSGLVFVADAGRQSVLLFAASGHFVTEIREQPGTWPGFTLPVGLLALPADGLSPLLAEGRPSLEPMPDEWVIVTDTLNAASLNVLGVFLPARAEARTQ